MQSKMRKEGNDPKRTHFVASSNSSPFVTPSSVFIHAGIWQPCPTIWGEESIPVFLFIPLQN